jgi:hypothetical protein
MAMAGTQTAAAMRERFQAIPKPDRDAHQAFSIRVWRGLSWLERAEGAADVDSRFISLWIAFNAIYGHLGEDGRDAQDRISWQAFLARMVEKDADDKLGRLLTSQQAAVLHLIDNQFLFRPFWQKLPNAKDKLHRAVQKTLLDYRHGNTLPILQELFERLYVMRQQVFHGAATSGSKLNRAALEAGTHVLSGIVPAMIDVMIVAGPAVDWGEVCFPPVS